jgi:ubiquinol-cytochrome c reductase cytochrome b subunit
MNKLGAIAPAVRGFFFPIEKPAQPQLPSTPVSPAVGPQQLEDVQH